LKEPVIEKNVKLWSEEAVTQGDWWCSTTENYSIPFYVDLS
jgi:hypothetical protein